ncbi:hypothetical protein PENSPDRAFT_671234 [Peniophora sp. CONT]|nr:hypothetical protein PENSPDRAFT_671234 [Peniophora sp. CONT]
MGAALTSLRLSLENSYAWSTSDDTTTQSAHSRSVLPARSTHPVCGFMTTPGPYIHSTSLLDWASVDWYNSSAVNAELDCSISPFEQSTSGVDVRWANLAVKAEVAVANVQLATVHPPSATVHPPSATVHPPSATVHPPSATVHPPSATVHSPSATVHPLNVNDEILLPWSPKTKMLLVDINTSVSVYLDELRSESFISASLAERLNLSTKVDNHDGKRKYITTWLETQDGFFISKKCKLILRKSCKGHDLILGRDFIQTNHIHIDYMHQTCRYDILAYDIITQSPLHRCKETPPVIQSMPVSKAGSYEDHYFDFTEQLRDRMLRRAQDIAPFYRYIELGKKGTLKLHLDLEEVGERAPEFGWVLSWQNMFQKAMFATKMVLINTTVIALESMNLWISMAASQPAYL